MQLCCWMQTSRCWETSHTFSACQQTLLQCWTTARQCTGSCSVTCHCTNKSVPASLAQAASGVVWQIWALASCVLAMSLPVSSVVLYRHLPGAGTVEWAAYRLVSSCCALAPSWRSTCRTWWRATSCCSSLTAMQSRTSSIGEGCKSEHCSMLRASLGTPAQAECASLPCGQTNSSFCRYFKYTAWLLPLSYNSYADRLELDRTPGGETPLIVHHTIHKPFAQAAKAKTSYPGHQFLCSGCCQTHILPSRLLPAVRRCQAAGAI